MLRVNLCKAEYFRVCQRSSVLLLNLMQVLNLLGREGKTFLLVVFLQVLNAFDRLWLNVYGEDILIQSGVHALQHLVVLGILAVYREVFLDALDTFQSHVLGNLHSVGTPWGNHFAARTYEETLQFLCVFWRCVAI